MPTVTGFHPTSGEVGTAVTTIATSVPAGAAKGPIAVTTLEARHQRRELHRHDTSHGSHKMVHTH